MNNPDLISRIIPPNDYLHREGFANTDLIDKLSTIERKYVEDTLITMLKLSDDLLIVETLAYLKSKKSVPILYKMLFENSSSEISKIVIAAAIYAINIDENMINIVIEHFNTLKSKYSIIPAFNYLKKLNTQKTDDLIRKFTNSSDFLIAYNAKRVLGDEQ